MVCEVFAHRRNRCKLPIMIKAFSEKALIIIVGGLNYL